MIVKLKKENFNEVLEKAVNALNQGKVIIYPTETSYGIGCLAEFENAVERIYEIKKRNKSKPFILIADSLETIEKYGGVNENAIKLAKHFMPGPLSLAIKRKKGTSRLLGKELISFRISSNEFANELAKAVKQPIISTSCNFEGEPAIYNSSGLKEFENKVDLIIDAGNLPENKASTLFDTVNMRVLREGSVKESQILNLLGNFPLEKLK